MDRFGFRSFVVVVTFLLVIAACGTPSRTSQGIDRGYGPGGTVLSAFPSSEDFYRLPAHLAPAPPGSLVRIQMVSNAKGFITLRVMYHSHDSTGHDAAVTGLITYPTTAAPKGGWPVVAWDHGTSGMSQSCAPSRSGAAISTFGVNGVGVATDYLGLGPDGEIHPYLNRVTEAEATIDIVRAARQIPDAHASATWVVVGDSQGGQASLATGEIAPKYAPELHLVGTVAIGPGVELDKTFPGDLPIVHQIIEAMVLFGAEVSDPKINPNQYLVPAAQGAAAVIKNGCVSQITNYFLSAFLKSGGNIFTVPPEDTPMGSAWLKANNVGYVHTPSPILVVGGGQDIIVVPGRVDAIMKQLCSIKDRVSLDELPGANHDTEPYLATPQIGAWIDARLAGEKAPTSCPFTTSLTIPSVASSS